MIYAQPGTPGAVVSFKPHYPLYWDPAAGQLTDCEDTLSWLALNRHSMELTGRLVQLRKGGVSRLKRKLAVVVPSLFARL